MQTDGGDARAVDTPKTYIVEHLDPELGPWSALEYTQIARECSEKGARFLLSSVPQDFKANEHLQGVEVEHAGVEDLFAHAKHRVCLLDPAATAELSPSDTSLFDVFLFGGILGDDPPRDRTKELRQKGFEGRRLGPVQMTTDTAARVARLIVQDGVPLDEIAYVDRPELKVNSHETVEMPFRYVKGHDGQPIMPVGMLELIKKDSEKGFDDFL